MMSLFDEFQLVGPSTPLPPRSTLVRLKPMGLGTAQRESLSSYFQRLADVHGLTPQVLARELVFADKTLASPRKTYHFEDAWRQASFCGLAVQESSWVDRLEVLTSMGSLRDLTLGFLSPFVSTRGLVTKRSKWCPVCLAEGAANGTPYALLLWSFKAVTCCPKHKVNLVFSCGCSKPEWKPKGRVKGLPHVCPHCAGSLGRHDHPKATKPSPKKLLHADLISDLLTSDLATGKVSPERTLADFLQASVQQLMEGNANKLAGLLGVTKSSLSGWVNGKHNPDFARILQIAELHGCSLEDVLCGRSEQARLTPALTKEPVDGKCSHRGRSDIDWKGVVASLHEALNSETPLPLNEVAAQVGVATDTLRNHEPKLCKSISSRWLAWRKILTSSRDMAYAEQVRMAAMSMANQGKRPNWQRLIEGGLPVVPIWQWRKFVQTICDETWEQAMTALWCA